VVATSSTESVDTSPVEPKELLIKEARQRTRWRRGLYVVIVAVVMASVASGVMIGASHTRPTPAPSAFAGHRYPAGACGSANPTALLIPPSELSHMVFAPSPGRPIATGGQQIFLLRNPLTRPTRRSEESSAALISEQMFNQTAPTAAIQNASSFNVSHPYSVVVFNEAVTGFTDRQAESDFMGFAGPSIIRSEAQLRGRLVYVVEHSKHNDPRFASPNWTNVQSLPGSNTPSTVSVAIQYGATVVAFSFEGGVALSIDRVRPIVNSALERIERACGALDIMAPR